MSPNDITDWKEFFIIGALNQKNYAEVKQILRNNGLVEMFDFARYSEVFKFFDEAYMPSSMMIQTLNDKPIKNFDCRYGMNKVDYLANGFILPCCNSYIHHPIGNIAIGNSILDEWNSYKSKIMKLSFVNKTFSFCDKVACSKFCIMRGQLEYDELQHSNADYSDEGKPYPGEATLNIDKACNLRCESCRNEYITNKDEENTTKELLADKISAELLPYVDDFIMAGDGDLFYSQIYRKMWINNSSKKRKAIIAKTNGLLFGEKNWKLLNDGYDKVRLHVSIDASTKQVYEQVRRGGNWDVLCKNMEYASELRKREELAEFSIYFVVQQKNYKDAKHFVELGVKWGCDRVCFSRVVNWGTYDLDSFNKSITLFKDNGTGSIKDDYKGYFDDAIFENPIVEGISVFRK